MLHATIKLFIFHIILLGKNKTRSSATAETARI